MKLKNIKFTLSIVPVLLLSACDKGPPIPEDKFMQAYVDILVAQDTTTTTPFSMDSLRTVILKNNNLLPEQYDAMIEYYNARPEKWNPFFDSVTVYVERLKSKAGNQP